MRPVGDNAAEELIKVILKLSLARDLPTIVEIIRHAARDLTGADGATFILRDGNKCYYVDEDAISPLWKGLRFPMEACVSGWAMLHKENVIIPDIYSDSRVPVDAYRPTFVKSMVMIPIRKQQPIGAIGNYWASNHHATPEELRILEALADSTSICLENIQLMNELNHQLNLRDEFIAISAHELRTPLTPLLLQMQLIMRELENASPPIKNSLEKAQDHIKEFGALVDNLVHVSKIRLGSFTHHKSHSELNTIIRDSVELLRLKSKSEIQFHQTRPIFGLWDEDKIGQVVRNIIHNAIKYGEGKLIEIETKKLEDFAEFSIKDNGIGISREDQMRIFRRFERTQNLNYGGMGLGLYVASKIVEDHRGEINVMSEPNKGSTFTVRLPLI